MSLSTNIPGLVQPAAVEKDGEQGDLSCTTSRAGERNEPLLIQNSDQSGIKKHLIKYMWLMGSLDMDTK